MRIGLDLSATISKREGYKKHLVDTSLCLYTKYVGSKFREKLVMTFDRNCRKTLKHFAILKWETITTILTYSINHSTFVPSMLLVPNFMTIGTGVWT